MNTDEMRRKATEAQQTYGHMNSWMGNEICALAAALAEAAGEIDTMYAENDRIHRRTLELTAERDEAINALNAIAESLAALRQGGE